MAKNLDTFMPSVKIPAEALEGFEIFYSGDQNAGDFDTNRDQDYGRHTTRFCYKTSMCDVIVYTHGGGEGGAGFCCCQQGDPGYSGVGQRYSLCDVDGNVGCSDYIVMCTGPGGCVCSTCYGRESCLSSIHHCRKDGTSIVCICAGAFNGGSNTNCNWGYSNSDNIAARGVGTCWNSFQCSGSNCGTCCITHDVKRGQPNCIGWDCNYCVSCGNAGYNMYRGQCCSDGRCGVNQMGSGPNVTGPFVVGNHIMRMGTACQQEHSGFHGGMCQFWYETGQIDNNPAHMRTTGRSTTTGSGCAGGCQCGSFGTPGWGYIRYKDPDYVENGEG